MECGQKECRINNYKGVPDLDVKIKVYFEKGQKPTSKRFTVSQNPILGKRKGNYQEEMRLHRLRRGMWPKGSRGSPTTDRGIRGRHKTEGS